MSGQSITESPSARTTDAIRLLLVEDNKVDQMAFMRGVEKEKLGYAVTVAGSVAEARQILEHRKFDIIVLDHMLQDGTGFDLLPAAGTTPAIFVTGADSPENAVRAMQLGASDYLIKDHDKSYLRLLPTAVDRALKKARADQEQLLLQEMLRHNREQLDSIINTVDGIVWEADAATFQFTFVSRRAERLLGYPLSRWLQEPSFWADHLHPEDREKAVNYCLQATRENRDHEFEYRMVAADGQHIWMRDIVTVVAEDGRAVKLRGIMVDITDRRALEEQLRQAQKMEAIGQLAGGVAHDFNNILAAMIMETDMARQLPDLPSEARASFASLRSSADRATNLTRQLLAFSRKQVMQSRALDLNELVAHFSGMLQRVISAEIHFTFRKFPRPAVVRGDAGMLEQVLLNLVVNSRDAMPRGGNLAIEISELADDEQASRPVDIAPGHYYRLSVMDTGTGIAPENLPRLFEPFFTTKPPGQGTGLGLATAFGIVKQHGGAIQAESRVGEGSNFHIFLHALESDTTPAGKIEPPKIPVPQRGRETLLIVEDEANVRALTALVLKRNGYKVLEAANGVDALHLWEKHPETIHLLFTDLIMPGGIGGQELAAQLQQRNPALRVVFTSGYSAEIAGRELNLKAGQNFIQKPSTVDAILSTLRRSLDS